MQFSDLIRAISTSNHNNFTPNLAENQVKDPSSCSIFCAPRSSASRAFVTRKRFSACWGSLHSVPVRAKPRSTGPRAPPIPIERCLWHRAARLRSTPVRAKQTSTGRLAPVPDALTAVPAKEKTGMNHHPGFKNIYLCLQPPRFL